MKTTDPSYWKLYPIKRNWCRHNQGVMTPYGSLYCTKRQMTVEKDYQCKECKDKTTQYELFMEEKS